MRTSAKARVLVDVEIRDDAGALVARFKRARVYDRDDGTRAIVPIPDDLDDDELELALGAGMFDGPRPELVA
jgi:hypothetical protein